jgi:RNA recognition motif-containing protein
MPSGNVVRAILSLPLFFFPCPFFKPTCVFSHLPLQNLPPDADKLFLYEKFSPFGAILSVKVLTDPQSGQCRGVGFVNFAEHASAVRSIQALHGTKVGDKSMHVSLQTPRIRASALHTAPM